MSAPSQLGHPRVHLRVTTSTNDRARELARRGAPHGTLVTASEQTAGRGRQGRSWTAAAGRALLCSLVLRDARELLSLAAGAAVAEVVGEDAQLKWPNDVLRDGLKVAGVLVEGRPLEGWAVLGIGVNVALEESDFPPQLRGHAGSLGGVPGDVEALLGALLAALDRWLAAPRDAVLEAVRARDALRGAALGWDGGSGRGAGIDAEGRLLVETGAGTVALDAGEVHLETEHRGRQPPAVR